MRKKEEVKRERRSNRVGVTRQKSYSELWSREGPVARGNVHAELKRTAQQREPRFGFNITRRDKRG